MTLNLLDISALYLQSRDIRLLLVNAGGKACEPFLVEYQKRYYSNVSVVPVGGHVSRYSYQSMSVKDQAIYSSNCVSQMYSHYITHFLTHYSFAD